MKEKPTYYAIIPAEIRYAKDLTLFQKMLYGEFTCLSEKDGFCWASNQYFSKLYDKNSYYISTQITDMRKKGYIRVFVSSKDGNKRKIYLGGIKENLNSYLGKPKDPYLGKPKHNNTSINTKKEQVFSYEKTADSYKSKQKIANQKGIKLKKTPRTDKQKKTTDALKWLNYYRDRGQELHGMQFFKVKDESRNKAVRKLIIRANDECNLKELIDWWLDGAGEWANYEPENCFSTRMIERFKNTKPKSKTYFPI